MPVKPIKIASTVSPGSLAGEIIKLLKRKKAGLSQKEISEATQVSQPAVSAYIRPMLELGVVSVVGRKSKGGAATFGLTEGVTK